MRQFFKKNKGFSILEITIALFVISLALVSILALVNQNLQSQYTNKNTLIASELAQEGLELVRNARDNNWKAGAGWADGSGGGVDIIGDGNYGIDYMGDIYDYDNINEAILYQDAVGFYSHDNTGSPTIFKRLIRTVDNTNNLRVACRVKWRERGKVYNYIASTILYDWQ